MRTKPRAAGIKQLFSSSAVSRHCCGAMELHSWWVLVVLGAVGADAAGVEGVSVENTTEAAVHVSGEDVFVKVLSVHCSHKYSLTCLKMDAVRMVDKLGHTPAYRLFPGISLVHSNYSSVAALPPTVVALLAEGNVTALDEFLAGRVTEYLNSLTLAVKVLDAGTVSNARRLSEEILAGRYGSDQQIGRKKGGGGGALLAAAMMAAVGMAALAAVAGKAMMTSMLALMLAAAGAMRGGGGGGGGGGKDCGGYGYPAARRSIVLQDRPVYRSPMSPTYGPATP